MEKSKGDFEALNQRRIETLRRLREMISEEAELWARYRNGPAAPDIIAHVASKQSASWSCGTSTKPFGNR